MKPEIALASLATMTNGWVTDRRLQADEVRPCLFACGCAYSQDSLNHYLAFEHLWGALGRVAPPFVEAGVKRCGIPPPGSCAWEAEALSRRVAAALHTYRTVRLSPSMIMLDVDDSAGLQRAFLRAVLAAAFKFDITAHGAFGVRARPGSSGGSVRRTRRARAKPLIRNY